MQQEKKEIIELLALNEEKISELYSVYAEKFMDLNSFWLLLSNEETTHANWVRGLNRLEFSGSLFINEKMFKPQSVTFFTKYLVEKIEEARENKLNSKGALAIALDLENALIEKSWFDGFQSDSIEVKMILKRLKDAIVQHRDRIKQALVSL